MAITTTTHPIVEAAIKTVRDIAPGAEQVNYRMAQPRSKSMMWKRVRFTVDGKPVVGVGTFSSHAALFFYRGRELDDPDGLLQGGGKDSRFVRLNTPADADRPAVKKLVRAAFKLAGS